jgi:hypothetical protein
MDSSGEDVIYFWGKFGIVCSYTFIIVSHIVMLFYREMG